MEELKKEIEYLAKRQERIAMDLKWMFGVLMGLIGGLWYFTIDTFQTRVASNKFEQATQIEIQDRKDYQQRTEDKIDKHISRHVDESN